MTRHRIWRQETEIEVQVVELYVLKASDKLQCLFDELTD